MAEIKQTNPDAFRQLDLKIKELQKKQGKVGWFESAKYENGTPVAYVASIQEFGSERNSIPARPFLRRAISEHEVKWQTIAGIEAKAILNGNSDAEKGMEKLTTAVENQVLRNIKGLTAPPLSPITLVARNYRRAGKVITGKVIGEIAAGLKAGKNKGLFNTSRTPKTILNDTGLLIATLTHVVEDADNAVT